MKERDDLRIDHKTKTYRNGVKETAEFVSHHEAPREIVSLFRGIDGVFTVSSNRSLTTAEFPINFKTYGEALSEYYKRIHKFLENKFKFHDFST